MVKRKSNPFPIGADVLRAGIIALFFVLALVIAWAALSSYVRHEGLFTISRVAVPAELGEIAVPELDRLKGQNIFNVDLGKVEDRIRARYPQIGGLKVLRRFPDEVAVTGIRRTAAAAVLMDGRLLGVSADGFFIGPLTRDQGPLVTIKGLEKQKTASGTLVTDPDLELAFRMIALVKKDPVLSGLIFPSIDMTAPDKIDCVFGRDKVRFDVILDKDNVAGRLRTLATIVGRSDMALEEIKYIDLRFEEPVVGRKKAKK